MRSTKFKVHQIKRKSLYLGLLMVFLVKSEELPQRKWYYTSTPHYLQVFTMQSSCIALRFLHWANPMCSHLILLWTVFWWSCLKLLMHYGFDISDCRNFLCFSKPSELQVKRRNKFSAKLSSHIKASCIPCVCFYVFIYHLGWIKIFK